MSDDRTDDPPAPAPEEAAPTRALAKLEADHGGVLAIIPRDIEEAQRLASGMIRSGIVPDSFKDKSTGQPNASLVLMGVLKSMEVGLPPITGIGTLLPINNRFAIWGDGAVALAQKLIANQEARRIAVAFDPKTELADWPDSYGWIVSYWRIGQKDPYIGTFTVRDARRAGLWLNTKKQPWILYPDRMLFNRARAFALRDGFADALMGLGIAEEERDRLPDVADGGDLKPAGPADFLSDEPDTGESRAEPAAETRDLGTDADLKEDF